MVRNGSKLPDDGGDISKYEGRGWIPGCDISSLLDEILAKCLIASRALALACRPFVSKKKENIKKSILAKSYSKLSREERWLQPLERHNHIWIFIQFSIHCPIHSSKTYIFHPICMIYRDV
jgi:hypothetical protein